MTWVVSTTGVITGVDRHVVDALGYEADDLVGTDGARLNVEPELIHDYAIPMLLRCGRVEFENEHIRADGLVVPVRQRAVLTGDRIVVETKYHRRACIATNGVSPISLASGPIPTTIPIPGGGQEGAPTMPATTTETREGTLLAHALTEWAESREANERSGRYIRHVLFHVEAIGEKYGWRWVDDANHRDMIRYIEGLRRKLDGKAYVPSSKNGVRDYLRAFWGWCVKQGYTNENPAQRIEAYRDLRGPRRRAFTIEELTRLCSSVPPERVFVYLFAAWTGLRRAEIDGLTWPMMRLFDEYPHVYLDPRHSKAGKTTGRTELVPIVAPGILEELKRRHREAGSVMRTPGQKTWTHDFFKKAGLERDTPNGRLAFHSLRHTFATVVDEVVTHEGFADMLTRHAPQGRNISRRYKHPEIKTLWREAGGLVRILPDFQPRGWLQPADRDGTVVRSESEDADVVHLANRLPLADSRNTRPIPGGQAGTARNLEQDPTAVGPKPARAAVGLREQRPRVTDEPAPSGSVGASPDSPPAPGRDHSPQDTAPDAPSDRNRAGRSSPSNDTGCVTRRDLLTGPAEMRQPGSTPGEGASGNGSNQPTRETEVRHEVATALDPRGTSPHAPSADAGGADSAAVGAGHGARGEPATGPLLQPHETLGADRRDAALLEYLRRRCPRVVHSVTRGFPQLNSDRRGEPIDIAVARVFGSTNEGLTARTLDQLDLMFSGYDVCACLEPFYLRAALLVEPREGVVYAESVRAALGALLELVNA